MQSAAGQRALSSLASKLHPQVPLSPRESQQLLTLLTTSFRAHLDRAHPIPEHRHAQKQTGSLVPRSSSPIRAPSSHVAATRHIDSILTNPLFAVKPRRRASESAAVDVLRDPVGWFVDQIATGAATLPNAALCLDLLDVAPETSSRRHNGKSFASVLAEWLRSSGLDQSRGFVDVHILRQTFGKKSLQKLITLLFAEGEVASPWRWFIRSQEQRIKETNLDAKQVLAFRQALLWAMASIQGNKNLGQGISIFMQAFRMIEVEGHEQAYDVIRPAGAHLINRIISASDTAIEPALYHTFLLSSRKWSGNWNQAVESMLWLHHPTQRSASPGLDFLRDPTGAIAHVQSKTSRRHFLVQLCLGVARQLLEEERHAEAQVAMQFTKEHFADLVLSKTPVVAPQTKSRQTDLTEKQNLELLDQLVLT
ncbi:hypothetical protein GQ44DRAFT_743454 [Phaeosphaeriaceae sp. PMI808]|nr:hypothetical protein GQ44DRAFT_743454 [Phaeosphaeriaceae sp. PMI808]